MTLMNIKKYTKNKNILITEFWNKKPDKENR